MAPFSNDCVLLYHFDCCPLTVIKQNVVLRWFV